MTRAAAMDSRVEAFREETRGARMEIAEAAQQRFRRTVSWGVSVGGEEHLFTTLGAPVMTRLRQPERQTLDTLVAAGVAHSRSEALAWCVKLVGEHASEWIEGLRAALGEVEKRRGDGPRLKSLAPGGRGSAPHAVQARPRPYPTCRRVLAPIRRASHDRRGRPRSVLTVVWPKTSLCPPHLHLPHAAASDGSEVGHNVRQCNRGRSCDRGR